MIERTRNDEGVSIIIGAMLLTGILLSGLMVYQFNVVPELDTEAEAGHMRTVAQSLTQLRAEMDGHVENNTAVPSTVVIPMGHQRSSILSPGTQTSSIRLDTGDKPMRLNAHQLLVFELNGTDLSGLHENWESSDNAELGDIVGVRSFRLQIDEVSRRHDDDWVQIDVTDRDGNHAGSFRVTIDDPPNQNYYVRVKVTDADGKVLLDQPVDQFANNDEISPYWVDVLDEDYRFKKVLGAAEAPFDIQITENGLVTEYAITYARANGDAGVIYMSNGGLEYTDYVRRFGGGTLTYAGSNVRFESQEYRLENGALILEQSGGEVFKVRPHFNAALADNLVRVSLSVPSLHGESGSATGSSTTAVHTDTTNRYWIRGQASNLTLNYTTSSPQLWANLWDDELSSLGLSSGLGYDVTTGGDWARLDLWGLLEPDPSSTEYDLIVAIYQASIDVDLEQ